MHAGDLAGGKVTILDSAGSPTIPPLSFVRARQRPRGCARPPAHFGQSRCPLPRDGGTTADHLRADRAGGRKPGPQLHRGRRRKQLRIVARILRPQRHGFAAPTPATGLYRHAAHSEVGMLHIQRVSSQYELEPLSRPDFRLRKNLLERLVKRVGVCLPKFVGCLISPSAKPDSAAQGGSAGVDDIINVPPSMWHESRG